MDKERGNEDREEEGEREREFEEAREGKELVWKKMEARDKSEAQFREN